jgi:hypothetical protein
MQNDSQRREGGIFAEIVAAALWNLVPASPSDARQISGYSMWIRIWNIRGTGAVSVDKTPIYRHRA